MKRALFKCDGCGLEVHLLAPVERPCPSCGGEFDEIEERDDLDLLDLGFERSRSKQSLEDHIDRKVQAQMPILMEEIDEYLGSK